ncbi:hypothetical protein VM1G_08784 [Cytospora mali]|uniref:Uncharacterized protein n=1 Tax=Cytospora mali TaxID=578113 RepID=A0A194WAY8_CYTMA|nr:hypothetical protein VM1G_08784 [Valsa mali]
MTVPSPNDHVRSLEKELEDLHQELATNDVKRKDIKKATRIMASHFKQVSKKHERLNRFYERHKKELWFAVVAGNTPIAARAEEKMKKVIEEQAQLQRDMPDQYKSWAWVVKANNECTEKRRECKVKISLKEEEIHRLRPCDSVTCKHCKRIDITALKKAKAAFKDGVARILKVKLK